MTERLYAIKAGTPDDVSMGDIRWLISEVERLRAEATSLRNELTQGLGPLGEGQIPLTPMEAFRLGTEQMKAENAHLREALEGSRQELLAAAETIDRLVALLRRGETG